MNIIENINGFARSIPEKAAHVYKNSILTYGDLYSQSNALASYLLEYMKNDKSPVVVFGHKENLMLVCFLSCVKSGHAYIPVDSSLPEGRIQDIINSSGTKIILCTEEPDFTAAEDTLIITADKIKDIIKANSAKTPDKTAAVKPSDVFYIIYTSGSTGKPKGVQITMNNLESFVGWGLDFCGIEDSSDHTFLNQAPFSFDLSVMDLYLSLSSGGTIFSVDKAMISNTGELFKKLKNSGVTIWVSTPSFADMCLADPSFNINLMPDIKQFLFCGETLTNKTVEGLHNAFEGSKVYNLYGPTEATVAVTQVLITEEIRKTISPLPVGSVKPGCSIYIVQDGNILNEKEQGEIVITGDSVSMGYYKNPEMTEKAFFYLTVGNEKIYAYKTGDVGYLSGGQLYYCGRTDFQIKLNGYRIEIEDIENNFRKLSDIQNAVVIPSIAENKITHLNAFVVLKNKNADKTLKTAIGLKKQLKQFIPEYMVPKKIIFKESLPATANGKIDRKALLSEVK